MGEKRRHEARQERETFHEDGRRRWQRQKVLDQKPEALTLEAVERVSHDVRRAVEPSLVHVHRRKRMQERGVCGRCPLQIRGERLHLVEPEAMLRHKAASDSRLAAAAAAPDESNVAKPSRERLEAFAEMNVAHAGLPAAACASKLTRTATSEQGTLVEADNGGCSVAVSEPHSLRARIQWKATVSGPRPERPKDY